MFFLITQKEEVTIPQLPFVALGCVTRGKGPTIFNSVNDNTKLYLKKKKMSQQDVYTDRSRKSAFLTSH